MHRNVFLFLAMVMVGSFFALGCNSGDKFSSVPEETLSNATLQADAAVSAIVPAGNVTEQQALLVPQSTAAEPQQSNYAEKDIQRALKNAGFYQGEIDGVIGTKTKQAVEKFQEENSLKIDGKVGPQTWKALQPYLATKERPVPDQPNVDD